MNIDTFIIYCDGACSGNQFVNNKGGWGALLKQGGKLIQIYGSERNTTNQRMELTACIKALERIEVKKANVEIYSDSSYLVNCMKQKWYEKWLVNGWRNSKKQPVENKDLWLRLLNLVTKHNISFHKVSGHSGIAFNELADSLARKGISELD